MRWRKLMELGCLAILFWMGASCAQKEEVAGIQCPPCELDIELDKAEYKAILSGQDVKKLIDHHRRLDEQTKAVEGAIFTKCGIGFVGEKAFRTTEPGTTYLPEECGVLLHDDEDEWPPAGYVETQPSPPILMPDGTTIGGDLFDPGAEAIPSEPTECPPCNCPTFKNQGGLR